MPGTDGDWKQTRDRLGFHSAAELFDASGQRVVAGAKPSGAFSIRLRLAKAIETTPEALIVITDDGHTRRDEVDRQFVVTRSAGIAVFGPSGTPEESINFTIAPSAVEHPITGIPVILQHNPPNNEQNSRVAIQRFTFAPWVPAARGR